MLLGDNKSLTLWGFRLVSLILLLLAGYAAYQIMVYRTITTEPTRLWDYSSFYISQKAIVTAATFALFLAAGCALCIKYFHNDWLILLLPAAMIICSGQAGALTGFAIQSMAGLAVGMPIYRRLRGSGLPGDVSLTGLLLSWFLGGSVNAYFVWIALHWKINFNSIYFGVALLEIGVFWRSLADAFRFISQRMRSSRFTLGQWAVVLWTIFILPHALVPSYLFDEYLRHVFFPKQVELFGWHLFDPNNVWAVDTEVFAQSCYTIGYLLGGEYALRFANLASIIVAMLLIENFCRRTFGLRTAFFTALFLISTPLLGFTITHIYLEPFNFLSVTVIMIATMYGLQCLDRNAVILPFVLSAIGFLYKQQAVFFAVPLAMLLTAVVLTRCIRQRSFRSMLWLAGGAFSAIIIVAPFLMQNYLLTQNPFFPWLNGIFRSELLPPVNWEGTRFDHNFSCSTISDLTFHGERFWELGSFPFGINYFMFIWFIPLVFIRGNKTALKWCILGLFAASILMWWEITSPNMRYFIGPLSAGSILLGLAINAIWESIRRDRLASCMAIAALITAMTVNAASLLHTVEACCSYPLIEAFTKQYDNIGSRWSGNEEIRKVFLTAYAKFGKESTCLLISAPYLSLADQHIEMMGNTYCLNWTAMHNWRNAEDAFDWIFRKRKFTCVIIEQECHINFKDAKDENIRLLWSKAFREMVNIDFAHAGFLLLTPKTSDSGDSTDNLSKKDALDQN